MNEYSSMIKERLMSFIAEMSASPEQFVKNPGRDFTRNRKLSFDSVMKLLISMGGNSIYNELLESHGYDVNTATTSAFVQQRDKILPSALAFLFHNFTDILPKSKTYKGYRLLAADGSAINIATNMNDPDTYFQNNADKKGYNLLHLNALYDLRNRLYLDAYVQARRNLNEHKALSEMVDRTYVDGKVIVIADRGYESYNNFAHIERKGWNYLIRVKGLGSSGILSGLTLPSNDEFDIKVERILTRRRSNEIKAQSHIYRYISSSTNFDFLDLHTNPFYPINFRIVRFKIAENSYETIITNLDESEFSPEELKTLYAERWGIETSFRELKYAVGLINFHSKKREYIVQEIYARMILHNFAETITSHVVISQAGTQYSYQVNFTAAIHICRHFLRLQNNAPSLHVEALIRKNILPVRPNRKSNRKVRPKTAISFLYRIA